MRILQQPLPVILGLFAILTTAMEYANSFNPPPHVRAYEAFGVAFFGILVVIVYLIAGRRKREADSKE